MKMYVWRHTLNLKNALLITLYKKGICLFIGTWHNISSDMGLGIWLHPPSTYPLPCFFSNNLHSLRGLFFFFFPTQKIFSVKFCGSRENYDAWIMCWFLGDECFTNKWERVKMTNKPKQLENQYWPVWILPVRGYKNLYIILDLNF